MRSYVLLFFLLNFLTGLSQGNTASDIQIPGNPGLAIIGIQSAEITKPGNYTGLFSSLLSPIVSNAGNLPTDLAFEFSPYYMKSRNITYNELDKTNLYRDLKLSIASTSVVASDTVTFSRLGLGFKTTLLSGRITVKNSEEKEGITLALANDVETVINKINSGFFGDLQTAEPHVFTDHFEPENQKLREEVEEIIEANKTNQPKLLNTLEEVKAKLEKAIVIDDSRWNYSLRTGSFLEFAGGLAVDFPRNTLDQSHINRWGLWLNYTYRPTKNLGIFDFGSILRLSNYSFDPTIIFEEQMLFSDVGASLNIRIPNSTLIFSAEWVGKFGISKGSIANGADTISLEKVKEYKYNVTAGYGITQNMIWSISLSESNGQAAYFDTGKVQFLMGLSASLVPLRK